MKFVSVSHRNIHLLIEFINSLGEARHSFRYFNSRSVEVIKNHLVTVLLFESDDRPVAYGHLDSEDNVIWLGLCVLPQFQGMGYGNTMVNHLLVESKRLKLKSLSLTVDTSNISAIRLYEKFKFQVDQEKEGYIRYKLTLDEVYF